MRWWDGSAWTDDTYERVEPPGGFLDETAPGATDQRAGQQVPGQQVPGQQVPGQQVPGQQVPGQQVAGQQAYGQAYGGAAAPSYGRVTATEDGAQLAGWGHRLAARVIDNLLLLPFTLALAWPTISSVFAHISDVSRAQQASGTFDPFAIYDQRTIRDLAVVGLINLALGFVYELGFLLWRAATPGKLALGLRVRRWTPGDRLGATVVARRWLGFQGLGQLLGLPWTVVDCLWPLWDRRRQALHDKVAGTCVVRAERPAAPVTPTPQGAARPY